MACNSVAILSSPAAKRTTDDVRREPIGLLRRSQSANDLCSGVGLRRSYSDNHISYSMNPIRAPSTRPKLRYSRSDGVLPFQISTSIIPSSLRSFLFDPETSKDMSSTEGGDVVVAEENPKETVDEQKEIKRANWMERLLEIRSHWSKRQQTKGRNGDGTLDVDGAIECDAEDECGCKVVYSSDEEDDEVEYDRESFSKLLVQASLPDTKRFSQLAFLSNIAYVIPAIRAEDLRRIFGLKFVTSSIEKKAEAAAIKAKFEQDSTRVPVRADTPTDSHPERAEQKRLIHPTVAYDIAASAASYVQCQAKDRSTLGHEKQVEGDELDPFRTGEQMEQEGGSSPSVYNSEAAAYMAASTMTAVVAAGEREKQEAARDLQSLHTSPCEWFVCDDSSTFTRHFVIQKLLYSPLGKLFILQPDERTSPPHPLLPPGSALYALDKTKCGFSPSAVTAFINRPHPLHMLSYPSAYGSQGTILRDHDSSNYLKAVNGVLRRQRKPKAVTRKETREGNQLWPLLISPSPHSWSHVSHFEGGTFISKEVMTGV